jgi:hypothetical protein
MGYISGAGCAAQASDRTASSSSEADFLSKLEDQTDYMFIQRVIQEVTQSCALPLPLPASAIPPLILQAAEWFWENYDFAAEDRFYCVPNAKFAACGPNKTVLLPKRIIGVTGVYKTSDVFNYGVMGDFSLERMVLNNSALASGAGGSLSDVFGSGTGYNLTDISGALYEVSTYKAMFEAPLTNSYNPYSHILAILGDLGHSDLILQVRLRVKIQELYAVYYFFRMCVCFAMRGLATIVGTFDYKMPGGIGINYQRFHDMATSEIKDIEDWVSKQRSPSYFLTSCSI